MINTSTYLGCLGAFAILTVAADALTGAGAHPLFLIPLAAICAAPLLYMRKLNDRFALLAIFFLMYFMWYGIEDLFRLLGIAAPAELTEGGLLDRAEVAILLGGVLVQAGYLLVCSLRQVSATRRAREWPELLLLAGGTAIWLIATYLTWRFKVYIIKDASVDSITRGLHGLSGFEADEFMLATYLQPASLMILLYGYHKYRRGYIAPIVIAVILVQFTLGFVDDGKGEALSGVALFIITKFLVDGRIPKAWLVAGIAVVALAYPLLQANRAVRHARELSHDAAAADLAGAFMQALAATKSEDSSSGRPAEHRESVFERASMKDTVEVMFAKLGHGVEFRHGETLEPLLTFFIPRSLWPDKPSVQLGLLVTKEFFPENQSIDVNLSDSQLGELYWNFGWIGIVVGMLCIGFILGLVGHACDLSGSVTLTRVLVLGVTIQLIVIGFESSIATQYSEWLRMMIAIGALHLLFAHKRVDASAATSSATRFAGAAPPTADGPARRALVPRYPNFIR